VVGGRRKLCLMPFKRMNPGCCDCATVCCSVTWGDELELTVTDDGGGWGVASTCTSGQCNTVFGNWTLTKLDAVDWYEPQGLSVLTGVTRCAMYELDSLGSGGASCVIEKIQVEVGCRNGNEYFIAFYFEDGAGNRVFADGAGPYTSTTICGALLFSGDGVANGSKCQAQTIQIIDIVTDCA
jgi:hypothetical protein